MTGVGYLRGRAATWSNPARGVTRCGCEPRAPERRQDSDRHRRSAQAWRAVGRPDWLEPGVRWTRRHATPARSRAAGKSDEEGGVQQPGWILAGLEQRQREGGLRRSDTRPGCDGNPERDVGSQQGRGRRRDEGVDRGRGRAVGRTRAAGALQRGAAAVRRHARSTRDPCAPGPARHAAAVGAAEAHSMASTSTRAFSRGDTSSILRDPGTRSQSERQEGTAGGRGPGTLRPAWATEDAAPHPTD